MNVRPRPRPAEPFRYSDEQWARMRSIVERAGGDAARDKFNARRAAFEKMAGEWKDRISKWNGRNFGHDVTDLYKGVAEAARELSAALAKLNFPASFIGIDLVWKASDFTKENSLAVFEAELKANWQRYHGFCQALEHVAARAARRAAPKRRRIRLARDRFFRALGERWLELDLRTTASTKSPFISFIEVASKGVYQFGKDHTARDEILNVIRSWPRRSECKNRDKKT
jgi:hypothetical protein